MNHNMAYRSGIIPLTGQRVTLKLEALLSSKTYLVEASATVFKSHVTERSVFPRCRLQLWHIAYWNGTFPKMAQSVLRDESAELPT